MRHFNREKYVNWLIESRGMEPEDAEDRADQEEWDWENQLAQKGKDIARGLEE